MPHANNLQRLSRVLGNLSEYTYPMLDLEALKKELEQTRETIEPVEQPRLYQVETTTRCNLECTFCPRTIDLKVNKQRDLEATMPINQFVRVLNNFPNLQSIELYHFGEPFMHKDFDEYVRICAHRGITVLIATNLLPATPEKIDAVFEAGEGFLYFCMDVDSLDATRYASMRVRGNLRMLQERVRYVLKHPRRPYCVVHGVGVDGHPEYTPEQLQEWLGDDCPMPDEVRVKYLDSFRGATTQHKQGMQPEDLCREPFYGCTVQVNGNVVPCNRDWAGEAVMGNIFEQSIEEIWRGEKFRAFQAQMKSTDKPDICKKCAEGRLFNARSQPRVQLNMFLGKEVEG